MIVGLQLATLELAQLFRPPQELVIGLVHDLIDRIDVKMVGPALKESYFFSWTSSWSFAVW